MKNLSIKSNKINLGLVITYILVNTIAFVSCGNESDDRRSASSVGKLAILSLTQQKPVSEDVDKSQRLEDFIESAKFYFSKHIEATRSFSSDDRSNLQSEIKKDLEKVTQTALKAKSEDELNKSTRVLSSLLSEESSKEFENALKDISNPEIFSEKIIKMDKPQAVKNILDLQSKATAKGFVWGNPGPIGWYCYSPIFGKMGPHPDFWFSAVVCAWAQGVLVLASSNGCYVLNDDPSFFCW